MCASIPSAGRYTSTVTVVSVLLIAASLVVMARTMPMDRVVDWIGLWIEQFGFWGLVIYGAIYALAAVLLVPGWPLTVAAGALFGLGWGLVSVWLGATLGATLAFLIARYGARRRVARMLQHRPKFNALDRAIGRGGWKIVALLRLNPVVPYNLSNYAFGLTAVRFWPYVLATWLFMLPGAFLYTYFGYLGRAGLADAGNRTWVWVLRIVGLAVTIAVVVYVTKLARRGLEQQTDIMQETDDKGPRRSVGGGRWGATAIAAVAVLLVVVAGWTYGQRERIRQVFGPPTVELTEAYDARKTSTGFDHSLFDALVKRYVDEHGWVGYESLAKDTGGLDRYVKSLADAPFDAMGRDEKLALLINAYNAFTLRLILDYYPLKSIKDIPAAKRWDHKRWIVGGNTWSLNDIEHRQIRAKFKEPRIHFALVCAAVGCPKLLNEAYSADRLGEQLESQTMYAHEHDRWLKLDPKRGEVKLTKLYDWYGGDFEQAAGSVLDYAARYSPPLAQARKTKGKLKIRWLDYDWDLNRQPTED